MSGCGVVGVKRKTVGRFQRENSKGFTTNTLNPATSNSATLPWASSCGAMKIRSEFSFYNLSETRKDRSPILDLLPAPEIHDTVSINDGADTIKHAADRNILHA
ncbi:hypothetical protein L218DRAFT_57669 [Marasmius fiardii PR-910]|nr:hypothetical protein L218DRAFT_57669 [Marasmius fiardii PR-910]